MNDEFLLECQRRHVCNTNVSFTNSNGFSRVFLWIQKSTPPNTWLRLRDYKAGALIEEYQTWTQVQHTSHGSTSK